MPEKRRIAEARKLLILFLTCWTLFIFIIGFAIRTIEKNQEKQTFIHNNQLIFQSYRIFSQQYTTSTSIMDSQMNISTLEAKKEQLFYFNQLLQKDFNGELAISILPINEINSKHLGSLNNVQNQVFKETNGVKNYYYTLIPNETAQKEKFIYKIVVEEDIYQKQNLNKSNPIFLLLLLSWVFFGLLILITYKKILKRWSTLDDKHQHLSDIQKYGLTGSWSYFPDSGTMIWSDQIFKILGYNTNEITPGWEIFVSHVILKQQQEFLQFLTGLNTNNLNQLHKMEVKIFDTLNTEKHCKLLTEYIINKETRKIIEVKGVLQDISEQKNTEDKLNIFDQRIKNIAELAFDFYYEMEGETYSITWSTGRLSQITGFLINEINKLPFKWFSIINSEDRIEIENKIRNAGSNTMFKSEYRITTKTGTSIWIEESCKIVFTPNNEKLIFCSAKDITKHKNKLYNELETNKAWKNIISAIDTELILLSQDGIIQEINPLAASVIGIPRHELIKCPLSEFIVTELRQLFVNKIKNFDQDDSVTFETKLTTHNQNNVPFQLHLVRTSVFNQIVVFCFLKRIGTDFLRKTLFSRLVHSTNALISISDFKTGVLLEVNNAFCNKTGYSRNEILGKSSINIGLLTNELRKTIIHEITNTGYINNIEINVTATSGKKLILLFNAIIFNYSDKTLLYVYCFDITDYKTETIRLISENEQLAMANRNNLNLLKSITTELKSFKTTISEKQNSSLHETIFTSFSENILQKTEHFLSKSQEIQNQTSNSGSLLKNKKQTNQFPPRILIVEDNYSNRILLEELMNKWGYYFDAVDGRTSAITKLNNGTKYDIVLLDMILADGQKGYELAKIIGEYLPKVPIIAVSGAWNTELETLAVQSGCKDFIQKPINVEKLRLSISVQLESNLTK